MYSFQKHPKKINRNGREMCPWCIPYCNVLVSGEFVTSSERERKRGSAACVMKQDEQSLSNARDLWSISMSNAVSFTCDLT